MADIYLYADETGNLDYETAGKAGAGSYFGFGTATFDHEHGSEIWDGLKLRASIERGQNGSGGTNLAKGFHARNDSNRTRAQMFGEIHRQAPRIDATFFYKPNAFDYVRKRGEMWLYKYAWFDHFKSLARVISNPDDTLYVIVASLGTKSRQTQARLALDDVCTQMGRNFVLCTWDSATSWGLQVADYGLWAVNRKVEGGTGTWWEDYIKPHAQSVRLPWGSHTSWKW